MKTHSIWGGTVALVVVAAMVAGSAHAGAAPEEKCAAAKLKTVGAYFACRQKADAKATLKDLAADYAKCSTTFVGKWDKAEEKGDDACPDDTTGTAMATFLDEHANLAAAVVSGTYVPPGCGDGTVNVIGEQCDSPDFNTTTCSSLGHGGGALACTAGCRFDTSACNACPDGTIEYKNACWALGADDVAPLVGTCDAACASLGLTCDEPALATVADDGTDAECGELMDLLHVASAPHTAVSHNLTGCGLPQNTASGCVTHGDSGETAVRVLHSTAPKCSAGQQPSAPAAPNCVLAGLQQRACACR